MSIPDPAAHVILKGLKMNEPPYGEGEWQVYYCKVMQYFYPKRR